MQFTTSPMSPRCVQRRSCSPTVAGAIRVTFCLAAAAAGLQWLDLSLYDNGFVPGLSSASARWPLVSRSHRDGLRPAATHYVRLNTLSDGHWWRAGIWYSRQVFCGGPALLGPLSESATFSRPTRPSVRTPAVPQGSNSGWISASTTTASRQALSSRLAAPSERDLVYLEGTELRHDSLLAREYPDIGRLVLVGDGIISTGCAPPPHGVARLLLQVLRDRQGSPAIPASAAATRAP